jgi:hypothetical protein
VPATSELDAVVSDAVYYLIPQLTQELKAAATTSGWPKTAIDVLSVSFDGSNILVEYPPQTARMIEDLEYGNGSDLPNSVIRSFIYRSGDTVKSVLANRSVNNLFESEGVFGG